ncbi:MAG: hypothetical protein HWN65_08400 [Candidatus Helarchaeota archaeon]|nr:hypothetical protein [Candidatus Helarchaeota archaeon]
MSLFPSGKKTGIVILFDSNFYKILKEHATSKGLRITSYIRSTVMDSIPEEDREDLGTNNPNPEGQEIRLTKGTVRKLTRTHRDMLLELLIKINEDEEKEEEEARRVEEEIERVEEEEERKKFWEEYHKEEWEDEK